MDGWTVDVGIFRRRLSCGFAKNQQKEKPIFECKEKNEKQVSCMFFSLFSFCFFTAVIRSSSSPAADATTFSRRPRFQRFAAPIFPR